MVHGVRGCVRAPKALHCMGFVELYDRTGSGFMRVRIGSRFMEEKHQSVAPSVSKP